MVVDGPLAGKRILVTRPRAQSGSLAEGLEALGAEVLAIPTIRTAAPADPQLLAAAAGAVASYDWVVFTSANGAAAFWAALGEQGLDSAALEGVSICAIGPATAAAVESRGAKVDLIPESFVAEGVVAALAATNSLVGKRILLPRAEHARDVLPQALRALGAWVDDVPTYRTIPDTESERALGSALSSGGLDVVTFTSGSSARSFAELAGHDLHGAEVATIGPITSGVVRDLGWEVAIEADIHTSSGLVEAIRAHFDRRRR